MRAGLVTSCAAVLAVAAFHPDAARAAAISVGDPNGYLIIDQRSANTLGRATGERIVYGDTDVIPNGSAGTTGTASTANTFTGIVSQFSLPFNGSPAIPNQFSSSTPYNAGLTGPWTLTFTNGADTKSVVTPSITGLSPPPLASNVSVSGSASNPTFSWSYPASSVNGVFFDIYDASVKNAAGGAAIVYSAGLTGTTNSFTVPNALSGGLTLQTDHIYTLDLYGVVTRDGSNDLSNQNSQAWSESYFDFKTSSTATAPVNLPILTSTGAYQFSMTVMGGVTYYIDPVVATGYDYATAAGDPNFASVLLPTIQTTAYDLTYTYGGSPFDVLVAPGAAYAFPTGGVASFRVTGIDPALGLNPADTTAFETGLTFVASGTFDGTQTPLTTDIQAVPEPPALALLGVSVAAVLGLARRRPHHIPDHHDRSLVAEIRHVPEHRPTFRSHRVLELLGRIELQQRDDAVARLLARRRPHRLDHPPSLDAEAFELLVDQRHVLGHVIV